MKSPRFAIYDKKSMRYGAALPFADNIAAERNFVSIMAGDNMMSRFPDQFNFQEMGDYDDKTGKSEDLPNPRIHMEGQEAVYLLRKIEASNVDNSNN